MSGSKREKFAFLNKKDMNNIYFLILNLNCSSRFSRCSKGVLALHSSFINHICLKMASVATPQGYLSASVTCSTMGVELATTCMQLYVFDNNVLASL